MRISRLFCNRLPSSEVRTISAYPAEAVEQFYLQKLPSFTPSAVRSRLENLPARLTELERAGHPVFVALGENCGPATKLREIGERQAGGNFFDNLVVPPRPLRRLSARSSQASFS